MSTPFWINEPTILLNRDHISQVWISPKMSFEEKLNAITRLVILLTVLGFFLTTSYGLVLFGLFTLAVIIALYYSQKSKRANKNEGFQNIPVSEHIGHKLLNPATLEPFLKSEFESPSKKNPLSNVLLTQIHDTPNRLAAPPSFHTEVYEDINSNTKKMVQMLNPGIKSTNKQLFGDLGEKFEFDQSQRAFYSTANSKVCNDQGALGKWLYGFMPSARDGNQFALLQDNQRYLLY